MPTKFQEKIDKTLEHKTPAWQDDIVIVTRSTLEDHLAEVGEVLRKLENAAYKASKEKSKFLRPDAEGLGYKITKDGIKALRDKTENIRKCKVTPKYKGHPVIFGISTISSQTHTEIIGENSSHP